jgi:hypothetical protein
VRKLGVAGLAGTLYDLLAEAGFFETDFSFFDFGWQAASLEALLSLLNSSLSAADIDVFSLLGDLGHYRHFGWSDFRKAPEDCHMVGEISDAIAQLTDA